MIKGPPPTDIFPRGGSPSVFRYMSALPVRGEPVSLGEGGTPLLASRRIGPSFGLRDLYLKNEGQNPTGSFKDRGMAVAVTAARRSGARVLVCASTGNTSASLAAYASRAGLESAVVIPDGKVAQGKLTQAVAYGAKVVRVAGGFDDALKMTLRLVARSRVFYPVNSINPYRIEGQKTVSLEVYEQLGRKVPDYVVLPVGNAGNISAVWKGFRELKAWGVADGLPRLVGVQAAGAAPIAEAYSKGLGSVRPWENPETVASAIRIGNPVSWKKAQAAVRESGGMVVAVEDREIVRAREEMSRKEGVFVEAASAAPVAALKLLDGMIPKDSTVVCIATGTGLKDQEAVDWKMDSMPLASDDDSLARLLSP